MEMRREAPSVIASEILVCIINYCLKTLAPETILKALEKSGAGKYHRVEDYLEDLKKSEFTGLLQFNSVASSLMLEGMELEGIFSKKIITLRKKTVMYMLLRTIENISFQSIISGKLDFPTICYLSQSKFDSVINNTIIADSHLEFLQGNRRNFWVCYVILDDKVLCWFQLLSAQYSQKMMSTYFLEAPAQVKMVENRELTFQDPFFPDRPIYTGLRPSLQSLSEKYQFQIKKRGSLLLIDDREFAVEESQTDHVINKGLYQALADVKLSGSDLVVEKARNQARPYKDLLIAEGHHYHWELNLPLIEFFVGLEVKKRAGSLIVLLLSGALKKLWELLSQESDANPFREMADHLQASVTTPKNSAEFMIESEFAKPSNLLEKTILELVSEFSLTKRESEILRKAVTGMSNREISEEFSISEITVKSHLSNIFQKVGVKSRSQLLARLYGFEENG